MINNGNIGTTGASTVVTGFHDLTVPYVPPPGGSGCTYTETTLNIGTVNGVIDTAPGTSVPTLSCPNEGTATTFAIAQKGLLDAQTAFNTLAAMPSTGDPGANLGGLTLAPGVWKPAGGRYRLLDRTSPSTPKAMRTPYLSFKCPLLHSLWALREPLAASF
jgi:hypothetical protein